MENRRGAIGLMLAATALLLLVASCSSRKKLVSPMAHTSNYEWFSAKMNGELTIENGEISFTGTVRMRQDSTVWVSASAFMGMENVRALVSQDSVVVINRLNQTYLEEALTGITLKEIQSRLLGDGTTDHVELSYGPYSAKIRYSDIHWNEPTTFPIKINKNYERIKL